MAAKSTTKSKAKKQPAAKKQPQQQPSSMAALMASSLQLAPPCAGPGPHAGGSWSVFPNVPDGRVTPPPCPGFWGFIRRYPTTGGIVAQLGADPTTGVASCTLYTGYQYVFTARAAGEHVFVLTLNLGPVSRRPRYGRVQIAGVLQIMGPGGHWADFYDDLPSNTSVTLVIRPLIQANQRYTLKFGVAPIVENAGYQSYGEAILNSAVLTEYLPYGVQSAGFRAAEGQGVMQSLLDSGRQSDTRVISLEEAAGMGVGNNT